MTTKIVRDELKSFAIDPLSSNRQHDVLAPPHQRINGCTPPES